MIVREPWWVDWLSVYGRDYMCKNRSRDIKLIEDME